MAGSVIYLRNTRSFNLSISINPSTWSVGAAPGHPLGAALGGINRVNEQMEVQNLIAYSCLNVNFKGIFEFPEEANDEFMDQFKWAQQLVGEIRLGWDWDKLVSLLPPGIMYSIQRDVRDVLDLLKKSIDRNA